MINKRVLIFGLCVFAFAGVNCLAQEERLANTKLTGLYARSIERVLKLPPEQIDIGIAALIVSEAWSDMVEGRRYEQQLDDIAMEIRRRLKNTKYAANAIPVINDYLFNELQFRTIDKADDPYDLFLHSVMDRRQGYCLSLSILYLGIGERLGLPLYGVVVPGHFFVRYDDGKNRFNIETTSKGNTASDEDYIRKFNVPEESGTIYLTNLNKRQSMGCFFNNLGNVYLDTGNIDQAMAALQWAVYINPSLAESHVNLGNIYLRKDRFDDAIIEYQAAVKINPEDSKAHNNLGTAYQRRQWYDEAANEYLITIRLDPNYIDAYRNLASSYRRLNRLAEARATLVQALTLDPKNAQIYCELGDIYSQSDNCEEAINRYEKALKLKPDFAEAYVGIGGCYSKMNDPNRGIEAYRDALSINPNLFSALAYLGNAYFAKGRYDEAIEQYIKAMRIEPGDAKIYYNIGAAFSNKGDYGTAVKYQRKTIELDPQIADAHYGLAFAYYKLKNYDSALKYIKIAEKLGVKINPDLLKAIEEKQ